MEQAWFNFENSLDSPQTKRQYIFCLKQFLGDTTLGKFLKLKMQKQEEIIIKYLVEKHASKSHKNVIFFTIKHACEVNDVLLNWKKIKKFIRSEKTGNEIAGRDKGYENKNIQKILQFADQRVKTAFLILASTGIRVGALYSIKIADLERIEDLYKITIYRGDKEQYVTFCTPECAKEIDAYLDFRKRKGENVTGDSFLLIKRFAKKNPKGEAFKESVTLRSMLQHSIEKAGIRPIKNKHKHHEIPILQRNG